MTYLNVNKPTNAQALAGNECLWCVCAHACAHVGVRECVRVCVQVSWCLKAQAMESRCLGLNLGPQPSYHAKEEERDQGGIGEDHKGLGLQLRTERKA